jgi:MFS transporter, DHA3 family, macrolide efflux protein
MSIRRHRDFLRIWSGQAVSNIGDGVHRIAVLWWARQATGSNFVVIAVALATAIPSVVCAPLAGWLVDRFDRRRLMVLADLSRVGTSGALAVLAWTAHLSTAAVVVLACLAAAAGTVFSPAYQASITLLVPADDRARANSLVGVNDAIAGIAGPAVGGVILGVWGTSSALWFDAGTFVVSLLLVLASRVPMPSAAAGVAEADSPGAFAGLSLLRKDRRLRDLTLVAVGLNAFVSPVPVLIVALAAGPLALGGTGFGLLEACVPFGMVAGFVLAPRWMRMRAIGIIGLALTGVAVGLTGATTLALVAGLTLAAAGLGVGIANTVLPTRFQGDVDPAVQGRVFALLGALMTAGRPAGLLLTAPLIAVAGVREGLAVCGACMLATTVVGRRGLLGVPANPTASETPGQGLAAAEEIDVCPAT